MVSDFGRPERVYSNSWTPKADHLRHELLLTDFLLCYPEADVLRGWLVNKRIRPDAEMRINGRLFNVELDTGHQSYAQVRRRQQRYAGVQDLLLYVTLKSSRLAGLIRNSNAVQSIALFTTLSQAQANPFGEIWKSCSGRSGSIGVQESPAV